MSSVEKLFMCTWKKIICPQSRVFVLPGPREKFSETEINYMKKYLESGGSIFVLLGEGGEKR